MDKGKKEVHSGGYYFKRAQTAESAAWGDDTAHEEVNRSDAVTNYLKAASIFKTKGEFDKAAEALRHARSLSSSSAETQRYDAELASLAITPDPQSGGLEKAAKTAGIISLIGGLFFLSPTIVGNVIGFNSLTRNFIGVVLLMIGLIGCFFGFKRRKK